MDTVKKLSAPVLLLNVNYEPLNVCSTKRALTLLFSGKAQIILNGRGYIQTSSSQYELPSVIRLSYMIKRPRPHITLSKREILRRDNYTCQYCGKKTHTLTVDHVTPRHVGGGYSWDNLVAACAACNRRKGGNTPQKANMPLRRKPFEPRASVQYLFGRYLINHQEWAQFIEGW